MVSVIDHQFCLTAVDTDVLTGDEAGFFRCQKQRHIGNIQRIAHTTCRLLDGIRVSVNRVGGINPAGTDGS